MINTPSSGASVVISACALVLGDSAASWSAAGFSVEGDVCQIGSLQFLLGREGAGLTGWHLRSSETPPAVATVDGLATTWVSPVASEAPEHPNGVVAVDHVVVASPDLDRTTEAFESIGVACRRIRELGTPEKPFQQRFFRAGELIIELIGSPIAKPDAGPASFWGLAFTVADIDETAAFFRPGIELGAVKDAVQPGRKIATLRHEHFGISVPTALMSPHVRAAESS